MIEKLFIMKRKLILSFLLAICILPASAQEVTQAGDQPVAKPVVQGIWIYLGRHLPKNFNYIVERKKEGTQRYEKLAEVKASASESEMKERQQNYQKYFDKLDALDAGEIDTLWQYFTTHSSIDSMYSNNLPMMHLLTGTAWFDNTAESKTGYIYRVSVVGADKKVLSEKESNPSSSLQKVSLPKINFSTKKYADGKLSLTWGVTDQLNMAHFNVYRTVFDKDSYQRIKVIKGVYTDKDSLKLQGIDSIGLQPAWYEYQIAAVDAFGNEGEMQGYISGSNIEDYYTPPVSNFKAINTQANHEVKISWRYENKRYLNGIDIMRSTNYDSGYTRIATVPLSDSSYTDILPVSGENYYYYLLLLSADKAPVPTAKIFANYTDNNAKPEAPNEIDAITITNGIKVYWKCEEPFSKGFYVYRRNNTEDEFTQISPLVPAGLDVYSFSDTSRQLQSGEAYEYIVRTINEDNQLSAASEAVSANPGIKKVIVSPMNLRYRIDEGNITIIWDNMSRWENNLLGYKVFRKAASESFIRMANDSLLSEKNFFVDSTIQPHIEYTYAVSSWDFSGNESEKSIIVIPVISEELPGAPSGIRVSQAGDNVYVTWGQIVGNVNAINIYRSEPGEQTKLITTISDADSFTDKNVIKGKLYFYQLATVNNANKIGEMSGKVSIRIKP